VATSLHQQLKQQYVADSDRHEVTLEGFRIDAVDRKGRLIEVQCASLAAIRDKIRTLLENHKVIVVKPLASRKRIVTLKAANGEPVSSRYSPIRQQASHIFLELVHFGVFPHPRLQLDVVLTEQQEIRVPPTARSSWKKRYSVRDRMLVNVEQTIRLKTANDLWDILEAEVPEVFTTEDLATIAGIPRWLAQKAAWCFRRMDFLTVCGKRGNSLEYRMSTTVVKRKRKAG
jgi:hypothetical protein